MKISVMIIFIISIFILAPSCPKGSPEYFFSEGEAEYKNKDFKKAIKYYSIAINKKSNFYDAYYKRAICKIEIDSLKSAIKDFSVVIRNSPTGEAYYMRANTEYALKDGISACADWDSACNLQHNRSCDVIRLNCK